MQFANEAKFSLCIVLLKSVWIYIFVLFQTTDFYGKNNIQTEEKKASSKWPSDNVAIYV